MQKVLQGAGALRQLSRELVNDGYKSVFLIGGRHFFNDKDADFLNGSDVRKFVKSGTNVTDNEIEKAFETYKEKSEQVIIAVGGGSVIDLAKTIVYRCLESSLPAPFFIAVPTTGGSGSEATHFAVVYKNNKKISLLHPALLPALAVLDPLLTHSLPSFQTAASGMDAVSQAIESYWSMQAGPESKKYSEESIHLWKLYFPQVTTTPQPLSREKILYASHLAGKAINLTRTTGPHALSYYLTSEHHIAHGQAVALFLPVFFIYNKPQRGLCDILQVKNEQEAKDLIRSAMKQAGLAVTFEESGLDKHKIMDDLLGSVNEERFANNPKPFNRQELKELFTEYL